MHIKITCFRYYGLLLAGFFLLAGCGINKNALKLSPSFVDRQLLGAIDQYKILQSHVDEGVLPRTFSPKTKKVINGHNRLWTAGFYIGTLWYLYEFSGDEALRREAERRLPILEKQKFSTRTHDLGFILYCSYGNAWRLTGNNEYYDVLLTGAESLIKRYNPAVKSIRSWDQTHGKWKFPVIVDNMMNLEYLNWASGESGNPTYGEIAITHANTTLKNHFREDHSSYHVIDYHPETGEVLHKHTHQGFDNESAWARGQAWGLYGYTMMYRDTEKKEYLEQARHIADFILNHPNLPEDLIPYWDFNADGIPNTFRDASAGAITASALLELSTFGNDGKSKRYLQAAETMIRSLSASPYKVETGGKGGFILQHSVGSFPGNSEVDVPLTYADYYYVEALIRYKRLLAGKRLRMGH
ncbi:glycoside hydrolase family 88 protein [Sphingobacterium gobiense]|uniref:Glucuronyl hydrolase n=1 Tax=Sphingobacterium gobiense TaxID=1382456 RepID=A0A2S9JTK4_9SPHI|nr:glycoside hydrolase family 88 protein [Sphingobacterium gobiense]PRD56604.1 glucuronyl hydrolase [Sphingobacterium gobiense]